MSFVSKGGMVTEAEQKQDDEKLRAEMLADTVGDPPLEVQLALRQQQFQVWFEQLLRFTSQLARGS